jgi:UDP-N-acetylglucosamine pyrophosphorylase
MQTKGVSVHELQIKLLQKVEELTLYLIEQDKTIKALNAKIEQLEKK